MTDRKYSTRFEDHTGLLHKLTKGGFARLSKLDSAIFDYEDLYQEACVAYLSAQESYDESKGYGFGAYMGRTVINRFSALGDKMRMPGDETRMRLNVTRLEDMATGEDGDVGNTDCLPCMGVEDGMTPLESRQIAAEHFAKLAGDKDKKTRAILRDLIHPSLSIQDAHAAALAHYQHGLSMGLRCNYVAEEMDLRFICKYHDMPYYRFTERIKDKLGITFR